MRMAHSLAAWCMIALRLHVESDSCKQGITKKVVVQPAEAARGVSSWKRSSHSESHSTTSSSYTIFWMSSSSFTSTMRPCKVRRQYQAFVQSTPQA